MSDFVDEETRIQESDRWERGDEEASYYQEALENSKSNPLSQHGEGPLKKHLSPEEMPWEESPQGRIKHLINGDMSEELGMPSKAVDLYMQEIPPGEKSGRHRHMAEELIYILEGDGYDHHWDPKIIIQDDGSEWEFPEEPQRFDWQPQDVIYIPPNTAHQHFNGSDDETARLLCCRNRVYDFLGYGFNDLEQFETADE